MTRALILTVLFTTAACSEGAGGAASGSAGAASAAPAKADGKTADKGGDAKGDAPKGPTTKLVKKEVDDLMTKTFGFERMKEPIDKRTAEVEEKLGKPAKVDGDSHVWYAIDENKACHEITLDMKSGAYSSGGTANANCGL